MPLKRKEFWLEPQYWEMFEEIKKRENSPSDAHTERICIQHKYEAIESKEPQPLTLNLVLQAVLGDELYNKHMEFLRKRQKEGESLEDVFRNYVKSTGLDLTKEEWLERIKSGEKLDPFKISEPSPCHYRVITEQGEWYCDLKKIPAEVCIKRQERHQYMGRRCSPLTQRKAFATEKPASAPSNRRFCKRDQHWFNFPKEKNCLECKWLPKECPVKKEVLREG